VGEGGKVRQPQAGVIVAVSTSGLGQKATSARDKRCPILPSSMNANIIFGVALP